VGVWGCYALRAATSGAGCLAVGWQPDRMETCGLEEPDEGNLHVRFCGGIGWQQRILPGQPTCYPYDCSTVDEEGKSLDGSSRQAKARTRLNSAFCANLRLDQRARWNAELETLQRHGRTRATYGWRRRKH